MKKVLFLAMFGIVALSATAQINRGQWLVGGNMSFDSYKLSDDDETTSLFTVMPNAGYFFTTGLAGGLRVDLTSVKTEDDDPSSDFIIAPFLRYYFLPPANKTNIFLDASYGVGSVGEGDKESQDQYSLMAGPAIFLTPNTALEIALRYSSRGGDAFGGDQRLNSFGFNVGFQIHLGRSK